MNPTNSKLVIVLLNCIPILGVAFYNWAPFEMFWLFWVETLIRSFFNAIRIFFAQNNAIDQPFRKTQQKYNPAIAIRYLIARVGIFIFYSLFIIVFIGFLGNSGRGMSMIGTIFFQDILFNLALLLIFVNQIFYLVKFYFMNKAYYYDNPFMYAAIFDGRQIVIHIAIIVGSFGVAFLFKQDSSRGNGAIWLISVLCLCKIIYELYAVNPPKNISSNE